MTRELAAPKDQTPEDESYKVPARLVVASEIGWRALVLVAVLYVVSLAFAQLKLVIMPLLLALLLTSALEPVMNWLQARGVQRGLAAALTLLGAFTLLATVLVFVILEVIEQLPQLGATLAQGSQQLLDWLSGSPFGISADRVRGWFSATSRNGSVGALVRRVVEGAAGLAEVIAGTLFTLFFSFFFLKDGERFTSSAREWLDGKKRRRLIQAGPRVWRTLGGYVRGLALLALFNSLLTGLALLLIAVPLVVPLMVITFVGSFIPFVGAVTASVVSALVALSNGVLLDALLVLAAGVVIQQFEGNVLEPLVLSRSVKLHPIVVLISVVGGAAVAGIAGAFLAVPLVASAASAILPENDGDSRTEKEVSRSEGDGTVSGRSKTQKESGRQDAKNQGEDAQREEIR